MEGYLGVSPVEFSDRSSFGELPEIISGKSLETLRSGEEVEEEFS